MREAWRRSAFCWSWRARTCRGCIFRKKVRRCEEEIHALSNSGQWTGLHTEANPGGTRGSAHAGEIPCPCCGYKTFPVPKEDALAFICPVCLWENDVFDPGEDQPSDENRGMTLAEGRETYRKLGAVREECRKSKRNPLPEEIP